MSEFTDELKKLDLAIKLPSKTYFEIEEKFKDWQPPKPREIPVEIPQRFADWFEEKMAASFLSVISAYSFSDDEDIKWAHDNGGLDLLRKMKLYGYTIEKEKKYILKHIDLSESSADDSLYLTHGIYKRLMHARYSKNVDMSKVEECHFTQSEIDKLNIGSYEQIAVKVDEVGG